MPSKPEQRTRELYKSMGYIIDGVNRFEAYSGRRHDFLACVDLIAFNEEETIAIQATSSSNRTARLHKCLMNEKAKRWASSPHRKFCLVTWGKKGEVWTPRIDDLEVKDFYV